MAKVQFRGSRVGGAGRPSNARRNALYLTYYGSGGGSQAEQDDILMRVWSNNTTSATINFTPNGADSYKIERATDSGFTANLVDLSDAGRSSPYNGSDLTYIDSEGPTIGQTLYYKLTAIRSGYADSVLTKSITIISFMPTLWYDGRGLQYPVTNDFAEWTSTSVTKLKSIINTSGPGATFNGNGTFSGPLLHFSYPAVRTNNLRATLDSRTNLGTKFTICLICAFPSAVSSSHLTSDTVTGTGGQYIRFANTTSIHYRASGAQYSVAISTLTYSSSRLYKITIERNGTAVRTKVDDNDWSATTTVVGSEEFILDRLFQRSDGASALNLDLQGLLIHPDVLSDSQRNQFFNYYNDDNYTVNSPVAPAISGISWTAITNNRISDSDIDDFSTGSSSWRRVLCFGDYAIVTATKPSAAPTYQTDLCYLIDLVNWQYYKFELPYLVESTDGHNAVSVHLHDNRVMFFEFDWHYDESTQNTLIIKTTSPNYNFNYITEFKVGHGLIKHLSCKGQYAQPATIGNNLYVLHAQWSGAASFGQRWNNLLISTDNGNSWRKNWVLDTNQTTWWSYPFFIWPADSGGELAAVFNIILKGTPDRAVGVLFLKSADGDTWTDLDGSFSKNVINGNAVTGAEGFANDPIIDETATAKNTWCAFATKDATIGYFGLLLHTDGLKLFYENSGAWVLKDVTLDVTGYTVPYGSPFDSTQLGANQPFAYYLDGDIHVIFHAVNASSKWEIREVVSDDMGDTWGASTLLSDNTTTQNFYRMQVNANYGHSDYTLIAAMTDESPHSLFLKKLVEP